MAYAFSPIDLIPDFIPVLGYLDDLILIPLGVGLAIRLIPKAVYEESKAYALQHVQQARPRSWIVASIIIAMWISLATLLGYLAVKKLKAG